MGEIQLCELLIFRHTHIAIIQKITLKFFRLRRAWKYIILLYLVYNIPKKFPPAAGFEYINQLCILVNTPKKFRLRRASLLGVCLHNVCICVYIQGECIAFACRRRENFGIQTSTKGNASNLPAAGAKILGIQTFIQREMHRICPPQAQEILGVYSRYTRRNRFDLGCRGRFLKNNSRIIRIL